MKTRIAMAAVLALATAAPAVARSPVEPGAEKPKRQCFFNRNVTSFSAPSENIVNLRVGVRDYYQLEMFAPCRDLDWNNEIGLLSRGSSSICTGLDAEIISKTTLGPQRCLVRTVRKLTPEEVATLGKHKP